VNTVSYSGGVLTYELSGEPDSNGYLLDAVIYPA